MNKLNYDRTHNELLRLSKNKKLNPRVKTDIVYSFGDILNIWTRGDGETDRLFIRDDHYLSRTDVFIGMDLQSYTFRTLKQITTFDDDAIEFSESYIPSIEDLLEHEWYEYIPMSSEF